MDSNHWDIMGIFPGKKGEGDSVLKITPPRGGIVSFYDSPATPGG